MPLVTVTLRKGKSNEFKQAVLAAVHGALVASGVPEKDRFHRVLELGRTTFVSTRTIRTSPHRGPTISFSSRYCCRSAAA